MFTQALEDKPAQLQKLAYLKILEPHEQKSLKIKESATIGRAVENELCVQDPYVSQRHFRVEALIRGFRLKDLDSRNGTFLNGVKIKEAWLENGDQVSFGQSSLLFTHREEVQPTLKSLNKDWSRQLQQMPMIAASEQPVLITGESGTGKEVLARWIHENSPRATKPFVSVNCSALSESLVESELFGHVKGSFTGAANHRQGAFLSADGGTLFLDEIGDLPLTLQPKLLRALENQEVRPVGSDQTLKTNVRILAATHQNIRKRINGGLFREDLYYRLNVVNLQPPSLKDRMEDFDSLIYEFAKRYRVRFSFGAIQALKEHSWPGNIRELKNTVARASALYGRNLITNSELNDLVELKTPVSIVKPDRLGRLKAMEREAIIEALVAHRGNQRKAAAQLGLPKSTLHDRIRSFEIDLSVIKRPMPRA